ncbi:hypothetical protein [Klebsiella aerogenes]|uniref:hypothetical protein n=1 Tax=Klebsiella aerogenes TaxID=548 RepID=UPI0025A41E95|nr:hypothetical protein [Klebsiella aerogenes]MDM8056563.1 hypothetical protein [Klebsiella aerogenes]MDM8080637.1 hypothetical protein [Klebsiella aerogenes]
MTDITELAQRVKTEASAIDDTQWYLAKPSEIRSLVEALEKAQKLATQQGNIACALFDEVTAQRQRIAVLEEAEQQLCAANVTLDARAELAERQLAELESRTVIVKLPKERSATEFMFPVPVYSVQELTASLTAQGIKWEAE